MDKVTHIAQLMNSHDERPKILAARALATFTDDPRVMDAFCRTAVSTTNWKLRAILIEALKSNPAAAGIRFSNVALWSPLPSCRKWALVNLSLLDCREAKDAVINGLRDPDISIRCAAALNAGLYEDSDVLNALERFFESFVNYQTSGERIALSFFEDVPYSCGRTTKRLHGETFSHCQTAATPLHQMEK